MDELELIKEKINIVDLIQEYLPLKKAGVNFKAPCPFHNEKSPSFVVSPERGIWHCFGCQKGGDAITFLMEKEGLEFKDALEMLAKKAGIELKGRKGPKNDSRDRLFEAHSKAVEFFHYLLMEHKLGTKALEYLHKRGLTDETIKAFKIGYAPNSWQSLTTHLTKRGFKIEELIAAGLVIPSHNRGYDRFRGRIVFPLVDIKGNTIGFSGRVLEGGEPKYLNTPQTDIFDKGRFFFGLQLTKGEVRQKKVMIVTEGEMDMLMSYQAGVRNVVASKGTALTQNQVEIIKKYCDTVALCFDMDLAGDAASRRGIEMADQAGLQIKVVQVPEGKDPAELCVKDPEAWKKAVDEAESIYDYYLNSVTKRFNPKTAEGKRNIGQELIPIWAKISDSMTFEHYLQKLAALLGIQDDILRREVKKTSQTGTSDFKSVMEPSVNRITLRPRQELLEEYLMALLLKIPASIDYAPKFPETIFLSENLRSLYVLLVVYLDSISFKGKSFKIADFIKTLPEEMVEQADKLYLIEIDGKLSSSEAWKEEIDRVVKELKKGLVKASLERLSVEIRQAQSFGKVELLETLNRRFRDLSLKLKNL